jgi:anti-anti-sigma regulatory factor
MMIHVTNGVPLKALFKPYLEIEEVDENTSLIIARESAVFSNWIPFRRQIEQIGLVQHRNLIIDLSNTRLVDHSVMGKLEEMHREFEQEGLTFELRGLDELQPFTESARAARKRGLASVRRITVVADEALEDWLEEAFVNCGATGYTVMPCSGAGRRDLRNGPVCKSSQLIRLEVIVPHDVCEGILEFLRREVMPMHHVTACVETVDVVRITDFTPMPKPHFKTQELQHT